MGQISGTFSSYDAAGNREDLSDVIDLVAQEQTPFMSKVAGTSEATNVYHEWQTDSLASVDTANYVIEGDEATIDSVTATTRVGNRLQISDKTAIITNTQEVIRKAGRKSEMAREMDKKTRELKRDMEYTLLSNQASVTGNDSTPRRCGGLESWLTSNVSRGSGGSSGGFSSGNTTAATGGTARAFTEDLFKTVLRSCADNGAEPKFVLLDSFNRQVFSTFAGNATAMRSAEDKKLYASVRVYESDFGPLTVLYTPRMSAGSCIIVDPSRINVAYLTKRKFFIQDLAVTGDAIKKQLLSEFTLEVGNEKAHGIVADLTTS